MAHPVSQRQVPQVSVNSLARAEGHPSARYRIPVAKESTLGEYDMGGMPACRKGLILIPRVKSEDLASLSKEAMEDIKKRGMVVIKNVLPEKESLTMKEWLKEHIKRNSWAKDFPSLQLRSLLKDRKHNLPR
ncbi:hypothetical protein B9Z19DRAFT_1060932 [Tuber borchii]|uniref:Uncharacterized protein n=1 Tax=Tuber borchii TaxID=42251 RepID=A0A2T7A764_TUBBO|nr:hypothetical protein B9Z19DRAFT_1060932 [Tuber borchii]